jgi:hypothetical protein
LEVPNIFYSFVEITKPMTLIKSPVSLLAEQLKEFSNLEPHTLNMIITECLLYEQERMNMVFRAGRHSAECDYKTTKLHKFKEKVINDIIITNKQF